MSVFCEVNQSLQNNDTNDYNDFAEETTLL